MAVVDGLDAAAAWSVILGGGKFQLSAVRKRHNALDQALAKGPGTGDGTAVEILDGSCGNLRSGSGTGIDHNENRHKRIDWR